MKAERAPLYEKVRAQLAEWIRTRYRPGDLLPTQREIASETGASLITVKRAILELAREGLVRAIPGKGTIVQQRVVADLHVGVSSWTESVSGFGEIPGTAWTRMTLRHPPKRIANLLELSAGGQSLQIRRLRTVNNQPICLMTNEVAEHLVCGLKKDGLRGESFYGTLYHNYGIEPAEALEEVLTRPSTATERRHLGEDIHQILEVNRRSFDSAGNPIEVASVVARPDRYRYQVKLYNRPQP